MKLFLFTALIVLTSLGLTTTAISVAQEKKACTSTNVITFGDCMKKREQALQTRMEAAFDNALRRATEDGKLALREEQEAWRAYLEKACTYYQDPDGFGQEGTIFQFPICRTNIIEDRASQLEVLFSRCGTSSC